MLNHAGKAGVDRPVGALFEDLRRMKVVVGQGGDALGLDVLQEFMGCT